MSEPKPEPPKAYASFKKDFPDVVGAYEDLKEACHHAGPLKPRCRELIKMGIAIGAGLESATRAHVRLAQEVGASPEQIRQVALLATTTIGFPSMMRARSWVNDVLKDE